MGAHGPGPDGADGLSNPRHMGAPHFVYQAAGGARGAPKAHRARQRLEGVRRAQGHGGPDPLLIVYRCRAPIQRLPTRMWKRECTAVGLPWLTFPQAAAHLGDWRAQAGTSTRSLQ